LGKRNPRPTLKKRGWGTQKKRAKALPQRIQRTTEEAESWEARKEVKEVKEVKERNQERFIAKSAMEDITSLRRLRSE